MDKSQNAIRNAFEDRRRDYTYLIPQFHSKKGEKPEDDWLAHFHVAEDDKKTGSKKPFLVDLGCGFIPSLILVILMEIILLL